MTIDDKTFVKLIQEENTLATIKSAYWRLTPEELKVFLKGVLGNTDWSPITPEVMSDAE